MDRPKPVRLRFGPFEVDLSTSELFEKGKKIAIQEKPFQLLAALLQAEGSVVTRQDLSHQLWPDTHVQINQGLNAAIRKVRIALHDDAVRPRFIETLGSRGYRFVHAVQALPPAIHEDIGVRVKLAVLPFENFGGVDDVIVVGTTVELIAHLGRLHPRLRVIAPFSAEQLGGTRKTAQEFRRDLKADLVLTGNLRGSMNGIRTTVILTQTIDQSCLWAETYDRPREEISAVQNEIVGQVARTLATRFSLDTEATPRAAGASFDVYEAYLRGRHFWSRRTPASLTKSIELFESAIARDPRFALAYAGLSDTYNVLGMHAIMRPADAFAKAAEAASKALEIDPNLPEGLIALGWAKVCLEYDFTAGEQLVKRALTVNPSYAHAHNFHAFLSIAQGDAEGGIKAMHHAQQLDPLSLPIGAMLGNAYFYARRYEEAIEYGLKALDLDPHYPLARAFLGISYLAAGQVEAALDHYKEAVAETGRDPLMLALLAHGLGVQGKHADACKIINELLQLNSSAINFQIALAFLAIGENETALDWLERARDERSQWILSLQVDSRFDALRSHPRFVRLLATLR